MAHAQKPDFVFRRNGWFNLNRRGRQFSRLLAAEVCASAVVMLDTPCSDVVWDYWLPTTFASFPFTSTPTRHIVPSHFNWTRQTHSEYVIFIAFTWQQYWHEHASMLVYTYFACVINFKYSGIDTEIGKKIRNVKLMCTLNRILYYPLGTALLLNRDMRFTTLQRTLFIYLINKYISLSDICLTVHHWYK